MNKSRRSRKKSVKKISPVNKFFNKIFVINLYSNENKWKKVQKQFKNRKINVERFVAIDGRCKNEGRQACLDKKKSFEMAYDVVIGDNPDQALKVLIPASSLTIGTVVLLRNQVKNKWKHMLICEDDIELNKDFSKRFNEGIKSLPKDWDLLYLGCGNLCGNKGISWDKSKYNNNMSTVAPFMDMEYYVRYKNDLRYPCDDGCEEINKNISVADEPGGTWCYAYSLKGAKKLLKLLNNNVGEHIDTLIKEAVLDGKIKAYSFDPPIVMHEEGAIRSNTDIPWEW